MPCQPDRNRKQRKSSQQLISRSEDRPDFQSLSAHNKKTGKSYAQDPDIRWRVADAALAMDGLYPQLEVISRDVDELVDHGRFWFARLSGIKIRATETGKQVVELAVRVSGGAGYFRGSELERLYRDVLAGLYHPSDDESAHGTIATAWLGPLED